MLRYTVGHYHLYYWGQYEVMFQLISLILGLEEKKNAEDCEGAH